MENFIASGALHGTFERKEVLRYLGYKGQTVDEALDHRIDEILDSCKNELRAFFVMQCFDIESCEDAQGDRYISVCGSNLKFYGKSINKYLDSARQCVLFAVTLGAKSEQQLVRYNALNPLDALVFDAACSALIEDVAEQLEAEVVQKATEAELVTRHRYSPGYGDFSLSIQGPFLEALQAPKRIGLTVTDTDLLIPTKSVTALVGLYTEL